MEALLVERMTSLCINECKKEENLHKIENNIVNPLVDFILEKLRPYILITCIIFIIIILSISSIIFLLLLQINHS